MKNIFFILLLLSSVPSYAIEGVEYKISEKLQNKIYSMLSQEFDKSYNKNNELDTSNSDAEVDVKLYSTERNRLDVNAMVTVTHNGDSSIIGYFSCDVSMIKANGLLYSNIQSCELDLH